MNVLIVWWFLRGFGLASMNVSDIVHEHVALFVIIFAFSGLKEPGKVKFFMKIKATYSNRTSLSW